MGLIDALIPQKGKRQEQPLMAAFVVFNNFLNIGK